MSKILITEQTTTLLKTLMVFIENRDPFTTENIINEIKRNGDQFDGFHDDKGECLVEEYEAEIDDFINETICNLFLEWDADVKEVFVFRPKNTTRFWDDPLADESEEYKETKIEDEEEYETDKEGNVLPKEQYDVKVEDNGDGITTYSMKPHFEEEGELLDDDGADWRDPDHSPTYEMKVDKQGRIDLKKKIFEEAGWEENERIIVIGKYHDHNRFFIVRCTDKDSDEFVLTDEEYLFGDYELEKGSIKLGLEALIDNYKTGMILHAKVMHASPTNDFTYIEVYV